MAAIDAVSADEGSDIFTRLEARATEGLRADGFPPHQICLQRALDMRYAGQGYEITLPCDGESMRAPSLDDLRARFDERHKTLFGHMAPEEPVEIVSYRVRGIGLVPHVQMPQFASTRTTLEDAWRETRTVWFDGAAVECPVYQRELIDVGLAVSGPAILDQLDCTTVIQPGQVAHVDAWKNLIVTEA
jgi:N-methylhydantoinase A